MPRRARTKADIQYAGTNGSYDYEEVVAAICHYLSEGIPVQELRQRLKASLSVQLTREEPWSMLAYAGLKGRLRYVGKLDLELADRILERYAWVRRAKVVHTIRPEDVAYHGAQMLLELVRAKAAALTTARSTPDGQRPSTRTTRRARAEDKRPLPAQREEVDKLTVHIGMGGGRMLRRVAENFAELLVRESAETLADRIVFHALIGGTAEGPIFEGELTSPTSSFAYLSRPDTDVETCFVVLPAPYIVRSDRFKDVRELLDFGTLTGQPLDQGTQHLHIVVTGAGNWKDEHNSYRGMVKMVKQAARKPAEVIKALDAQGCVGDVLWRPIGPRKPIDFDPGFRPVTLFTELAEVSDRIEQGTQVLMLVGPCQDCHTPRPAVVEALLNHERQLLTHLVVDRRSVPKSLAPP